MNNKSMECKVLRHMTATSQNESKIVICDTSITKDLNYSSGQYYFYLDI